MEVAGINWTSEQAPTSFFKEKESRQTSLLKTKYILHVLGILFRKKTNKKNQIQQCCPQDIPFTTATCHSQGKGVFLLNTKSSCVQHIPELQENKRELSNGDILTLDPCIQFCWHFLVMWMLDHC